MKLHKRNQNAILAGSVLFAMAMGLALPGCGSSNPTKKYSSLTREAVPPGQATVDTKTFDDSNVMDIKARTQFMYFYEGKTTSYYFKPNLQVKNVKYTVEQANLQTEQGMSLTAVPDSEPLHKGEIVLTWTPKLGTLGSADDREYNFILNLVPAPNTDAATLKYLSGFDMHRSFSFKLLKSQELPTFVSIPEVKGAAEGKRQMFSVVVKDLSANGNRQPSLIGFSDKAMSASGDASKFDASAGIFVRGEAQALGDNQFKFDVMFDGSSITMPSGTGPTRAHVLFRVQSSAGKESLDQTIDFDVARKASADGSSTTPAPTTAKDKKGSTRPGSTSTNGGGK